MDVGGCGGTARWRRADCTHRSLRIAHRSPLYCVSVICYKSTRSGIGHLFYRGNDVFAVSMALPHFLQLLALSLSLSLCYDITLPNKQLYGSCGILLPFVSA
jgi:hypothetical protein